MRLSLGWGGAGCLFITPGILLLALLVLALGLGNASDYTNGSRVRASTDIAMNGDGSYIATTTVTNPTRLRMKLGMAIYLDPSYSSCKVSEVNELDTVSERHEVTLPPNGSMVIITPMPEMLLNVINCNLDAVTVTVRMQSRIHIPGAGSGQAFSQVQSSVTYFGKPMSSD